MLSKKSLSCPFNKRRCIKEMLLACPYVTSTCTSSEPVCVCLCELIPHDRVVSFFPYLGIMRCALTTLTEESSVCLQVISRRLSGLIVMNSGLERQLGTRTECRAFSLWDASSPLEITRESTGGTSSKEHLIQVIAINYEIKSFYRTRWYLKVKEKCKHYNVSHLRKSNRLL